jgi:PAS domain S-box-containing protein
VTEPSYRRLVEQVPAVVIVFALGRGLAPVYVSPQTQEILGVPVNDWLEPPHPALSRIHADDRVLLQMKLAQQARGREAAPAELRWKRPDGRELWLRDVSGVVMEDCRHLQAMLVDITEAKRAEAERRRIAAELQLAHKLEAVGRLAAGVAHEINTPVQALGDTVAFLQEAFEDVLSAYDAGTHRARREQEIDLPYLRERVPAAFARAAHATDRIAQIVRTMGEQTHPAAHVPADLNHVARAALALAGGTPDLEDELPPITCEPGAIEQVLVNLLKNAHDAGGAVTLRTRASHDAVTISVSDTGPGIPPQIAERVFDPFFTTKDVGHGTGQGLAIARAIVDRHDGTLTFETEPGQGTTFHVNLRRAAASAVPA